jgi:hypothetical protein
VSCFLSPFRLRLGFRKRYRNITDYKKSGDVYVKITKFIIKILEFVFKKDIPTTLTRKRELHLRD